MFYIVGVAYATPQSDGNIQSMDEISAVWNWGKDMDNHDKVPSVISYTPKVGSEQNWGSSLGSNAIAMIHTKLELDVQAVSDELDFILKTLQGMKNLNFEDGVVQADESGKLYPDKSSEDVVTDYMEKVFEYVMQEEFLKKREVRSVVLKNVSSTDIVITIPTVSCYFSSGFNFVLIYCRNGLIKP